MKLSRAVGRMLVAAVLAAGTAQAQGQLYWVSGGELHRSDLDGSNTEVLLTITGTSVWDVVVEPVGGKLYWSGESNGVIQRSNLDGSGVETLVDTGPTGSIRGIDVDAAAGKIFTLRNQFLWQTDLDGSNDQLLYPLGNFQPATSELAADPIGGWIYVTGPGQLARVRYDGSVAESYLPNSLPRSLDIDVEGRFLYLTTNTVLGIRRVDLDSGQPTNLLSESGDSLELDLLGGKMYWWTTPNSIRRANLNGTGAETVKFNVAQPGALGLDPCHGPTSYCTGKSNSQGCVPAIGWTGDPSLTSPDPFDVSATDVLNNKNGLFFFGLGGPANLPFFGGTLCALPPLQRTGIQSSGGNPPPDDCSGSYLFDFQALLQSGSVPGLVAGQRVNGQFWYRDPGHPDGTGVGLSNGIEFDVCP